MTSLDTGPINIELSIPVPVQNQQTSVLECTIADSIDKIEWCDTAIGELLALRFKSQVRLIEAQAELETRVEK